MSNEYLQRAREQADRLKKEELETQKMLSDLSDEEKNTREELMKLKKKHEDIVKGLRFLKGNVSTNLSESSDESEDEEKKPEAVEPEEKPKREEETRATKSKPQSKPKSKTQSKTKEEKKSPEGDEIFDELDLDADDVFGDSLIDEDIDNIEF